MNPQLVKFDVAGSINKNSKQQKQKKIKKNAK